MHLHPQPAAPDPRGAALTRLFLAVRPPAAILERIAGLDRHAGDGVRWVPPDQWHVTLRFLGEADRKEATEALAGLVGTHAEVTLGPRVKRFKRSVVCLPAHGLDDLAAAVATVTAEVGEASRGGPFRGHLTLARLRRGARCGLVGAPFSATFAAGEVDLVASTLAASGARHDVIASVSLG